MFDRGIVPPLLQRGGDDPRVSEVAQLSGADKMKPIWRFPQSWGYPQLSSIYIYIYNINGSSMK